MIRLCISYRNGFFWIRTETRRRVSIRTWASVPRNCLNIWSSEKALLSRAQIVFNRRSLHRTGLPSPFPSHSPSSALAFIANFPSGICWHPAPTLAREAASSSVSVRSRRRHIILCKWAMQMSYANASGAISRQFVIFFISSPIHLRLFVFIVIIISGRLLCSDGTSGWKVEKKNTKRSGAVCFSGKGEAACSAGRLAHFSCAGKMFEIRRWCAFLSRLVERKKNKGWWAAGAAYRRPERSLPAIVSTLSSFFLNSAVFCESESLHNIPYLFIAAILFALHQTFRRFHKHRDRP